MELCSTMERSRLDKLGVKEGARVAIVGLDDSSFERELATRTEDVAKARPRSHSDVICFVAANARALSRLPTLARALTPSGALWVLWPRGGRMMKEDDIRRAALAIGLVDVKVVAFSADYSSLKLVIPLKAREGTGRAARGRRADR